MTARQPAAVTEPMVRRSHADVVAPLLAVAVVMLVFGVFAGLITSESLVVDLRRLPSQVDRMAVDGVFRELLARQAWGVAASVFLLAWLATMAAAWPILNASLKSGLSDRARHAWLGVVAAAAVVAGVVVFRHPLGARLPAELVRRAFHMSGLALVGPAIDVLNGLTFAAVVVVVAAACATLVASPTGRQTPAELAAQLGRLQRLLFVGAGLLSVGVVTTAVLMRWPAVVLASPKEETLKTLATATSATVAVYFTCLLAAIYIPAALALRSRAQQLVPADKQTARERDDWLTQQGLGGTTTQQFARVAATLSPILAGGPIGTLVSLLGS